MANKSGMTNADPRSGALTRPPVPKHPTVPNGLGQYGANKMKPEIYLFGTDDEIRNRNATSYVTPPETTPPHFEQITAGPTSKDLNRPGLTSRQGNSKYGTPRKYA